MCWVELLPPVKPIEAQRLKRWPGCAAAARDRACFGCPACRLACARPPAGLRRWQSAVRTAQDAAGLLVYVFSKMLEGCQCPVDGRILLGLTELT